MKRLAVLTVTASVLLPVSAVGQGTIADYQRAMALRSRYDGLALNVVDERQWIRNTDRFWYRRTVKGGHEFVLVDAEAKTKQAPFDHARMAEAVSSATGGKYTSLTLPFSTFTFIDDDHTIEFALTPAAPNAPVPARPRGTWDCSL
jgi:hypothetical protein